MIGGERARVTVDWMAIFRQRFSRGGKFHLLDNRGGFVISSQFAEPLNDKVLVPAALFFSCMGPRARLARGAAPDDEKLSEKSLKHLNAHVYIRPKTPTYPDLR